MSFNNKVVIVTGASSGIGAVTAKLFALEGANVVVVGRNETKLANVDKEITDVGKKALIIKADISKDEEAKRIIDKPVAKFGKLDILVNNAGFGVKGSILTGDLMKAYEETFNTNLRAVFHLTALAAPHLIKTKGNIVNVSSAAANLPSVMLDYIPYGVSKAALNHFSKSSALELARHGVRVNIVSPGPVATDFAENAKLNYTTVDIKDKMPLKRVSSAKEIADMILYVASDKAVGVTGSEFTCDNGALLGTTLSD